MANSHMRMRVHTPMLTTSDTAPIAQKPERFAAAPNTKARANAAHVTLVDSANSMMPGKRRSAASEPKGWGLYSRSSARNDTAFAPDPGVIRQKRRHLNSGNPHAPSNACSAAGHD